VRVEDSPWTIHRLGYAAMDRLLQVLVNAAALYVAVLIVPNLEFVEGGEWWKFLLVAVAFSLLNSFLRPILRILTFPITIVTMGLFLLVINAAMLLLTGAISEQLGLGFSVGDFWAALLGSIVISIVGWILSMVVGASRAPTRVL
jgi:putative membrane protein